jgi:hypothetical protein
MNREEKRKIRLRILQLIDMNRIKHTAENDEEIARLGALLAHTEKRKRRKTYQWSNIETYYLMNHAPIIGLEATAERLNRTLTSVKGKYYTEMKKKQKNFSPGKGREVV